MPEWRVDLAVSGPVQLRSTQRRLRVLKGENHPFMTDVELQNSRHGVSVSIIARAENADDAYDAAIYYVGRMLDVLCLWLDSPLYLSLRGPQFRSADEYVKRIVTQDEWREAFERGRQYGLNRSAFSRALSWYRKGLVSEDPTDKLLSLWTSLEVVAEEYARENERTQRGMINKVCDCFDQLWGNVQHWKVIPNEPDRVNHFYAQRNEIAHGALPMVDMTAIREVTAQLSRLRSLAHAFLSDWEHRDQRIEQEHTRPSQ